MMCLMPRARSTAVIASPIGPQPTTTATPSAPIPDLFTAWMAIAMGSTSDAASSVTPSSTFSKSASLSSMYSA
jgi:hypothetical protein